MDIMLLGESYSTGYGLSENETFCYILNNDKSFPHKIYNMASAGGSLDKCYRLGLENYDKINPDFTLCVFPKSSYHRREIFYKGKYLDLLSLGKHDKELNFLLSKEEIELNVTKNIDAMKIRFKNFILIDTIQDNFVYDFCHIPNDLHPGPLWNKCMAKYIKELFI